jgi:Acetyltransferase (GNAT) family
VLPRGLESDGQWVFALEDSDDAVVAAVWPGLRRSGGGPHAFVYAVEVDAARRRGGLGRRAVELLADEAEGPAATASS